MDLIASMHSIGTIIFVCALLMKSLLSLLSRRLFILSSIVLLCGSCLSRCGCLSRRRLGNLRCRLLRRLLCWGLSRQGCSLLHLAVDVLLHLFGLLLLLLLLLHDLLMLLLLNCLVRVVVALTIFVAFVHAAGIRKRGQVSRRSSHAQLLVVNLGLLKLLLVLRDGHVH